MRDPRKTPNVGDVITRFGTTRSVTALTTNERGTVTHVSYRHPSLSLPSMVVTISSWRSWARDDSVVVKRGPADAVSTPVGVSGEGL